MIIAPFFADVDTRGGGTCPTDREVNGRQRFNADWLGVGYFSAHGEK